MTDAHNVPGSGGGATAPTSTPSSLLAGLSCGSCGRPYPTRTPPLDVVRSLRNYNAMLAAGTAKFGDEEVQLDSNAMVRIVDDLNDLPIKVEADRQVFLRDVATATDASAIQTSLVRINGRPQVYVPIYRQQGASSLTVVDSVKSAVPLMKARAPEGVELDVVMDQSVYVRQAIKALIEEGILGALLAAGMILIFLGDFRSTLIATLTIPLAVLAAIAALLATGNTINAMTLGGLALAVGPLVDNAIVVLENTHRHMSLGKSGAKAALEGAGEDAVVKIQLTDQRSLTAQQYARLLRQRFAKKHDDPDFADLRINFDTGGMVSAALNFGAVSPIEIQVIGDAIVPAEAIQAEPAAS